MRTKLTCLIFCITAFNMLFSVPPADAGNTEIEYRIGYGTFSYEEETSTFGEELESDSDLNALLVEVSGDFLLPGTENFFAGLNFDVVVGFEDEEKWREDGVLAQTNDLSTFGQFYEIRAGYTNRLDHFSFRIFALGGWDRLRFERESFIRGQFSLDETVTEKFSLWRAGGGFRLQYALNRWMLDGGLAYEYYLKGEVKNSAFTPIKFDTNGTRFTFNASIGREIHQNTHLLIGARYFNISLDESDIEEFDNGFDNGVAVFPSSETAIFTGTVEIAMSF